MSRAATRASLALLKSSVSHLDQMPMPARHAGYDGRDATLDDFVSSDPSMQACLARARLAAQTDLPVLISGESGTGKTILARAIHNSSQRASGPFTLSDAIDAPAALGDDMRLREAWLRDCARVSARLREEAQTERLPRDN